MPIKTDIDYCDSTSNIEMGCDGCELWSPTRQSCYAGVMTERFAGTTGWPESFSKPIVFPERMKEALRWEDLTGKERKDKPWLNNFPRIIFLNDMGDTFTKSLPVQWLDQFIERMEASPHVYLILTKRPTRMAEYFQYLGYVPKNFWLGTSITSMATYGRMYQMSALPNPTTVKFLSIEPILGPIDLTDAKENMNGLDWVIVGGESGKNYRMPKVEWIRSIRDQCAEQEIPFFFKQWGGIRPKSSVNILDEKKHLEMPKQFYWSIKLI